MERADEGPERASRIVRSAPILIASAGLMASAALCWSLWQGERALAGMDQQRDAAHRTAEVRRALDGTLAQLRSVVALFASSDVVEPDELETFTHQSFLDHPPLRAILWVEARAGAPLAVTQSVGGESERFAVGTDLGSMPEIAATLLRSRQRSALTLSRPLAGEGTRVLAALRFLPGDDRAQGYVCALVDPGALLAAGQASPPAFTVGIVDVSEAEELLLAGVIDGGEMRDQHELAVGDRTWRITAQASATAIGRPWLPWLALGFGLVGTALLAATVAVATGRARIQRLVKERTREVRHSYDTLALEAKDRLAATAVARRAERRLRAIIDLLPELIVLRDELGRILLANQAAAEALGTRPEELLMSRRRLRTAQGESDALQEERALMAEKRAKVNPELVVTDAEGRRRVLRETLIPCEVFGDDARALLSVASDVSEATRSADLLRVQNRLLRALARGTNPEQVLADTVLAAEELVPRMRGSVLLLAPDGQHLVHGYAPHLPEAYNQAIHGVEIGPTIGSCGAAAFKNERVFVEDVNTHPNWAPYRELATSAGFRACWSQPIRSADGQVLGTFAFYLAEARRPEPFEEGLIESLAHIAGISIERARLEAQA
jgi:PAS domain S-box-containing protein